MDKLIYELPAGLKASNLYKIFPPYREVAEGHGLMGVVLMREDGKLQCHLCGEFFDHLSHHLRSHKFTSKQYRKIFSLRMKDKLVSKKVHDKMRNSLFSHTDRASMCKLMEKARIKFNNRKNRDMRSLQIKESKNSLSYQNRTGLCPDQINARFDIVACQIGRQPTLRDLALLDSPVRYKIIFEFGSFNKYIEYRKLKPKVQGGVRGNENKQFKKDNEILASIRNTFLKFGKVTSLNLIGIHQETVCRRFGTLKNACRAAGIDPKTWTMIG